MARRALVTGSGGFAGRHLVEQLEASGVEVVAPRSAEVDLLDAGQIRELLASARPDRVFHLAALASVGRSWEQPARTLVENQVMTLNLLEAVRTETPDARVLVASSGEVYGRAEQLPITETTPLRPQNPYAVSKATADLLGGFYADAHDLHVVRTRAFNHAGPGQSDVYLVGTISRQIAAAEAAGAAEAVVLTGNPDSARDFTDVRDVVRAYAAAIEAPPDVYNVASGRAVSARDIVDLARSSTELPIRHEVDPARVRASEVPEVRGSAAKLHAETGWEPEIPLEKTISDALAAGRN